MMPTSSLWSRVPHPECRHAEASRTRVLVVEDDLLVRAVAAEALEESVDVLFTDVDLRGRDGCALAQQALKAQPGLAVILTSGRSRRCHADRLPPGAAVLAKPYRLPHVIDEISRVVQAIPSH